MGTDLLPFSEVTAVIATVSVLGLVLLLPLYLSQRRDVLRLREWMQEKPAYPAIDLTRSESRLDRAELELERIYAERGDPVPGTAEFQALHGDTQIRPGGAVPPGATPLTSQRPALEQITMERSALERHPRWRRFSGRITQPRWLVVIAIVALALATGGIVGVQQFLRDDDGSAVSETDVSGIEVAVLNTTAADGIAGRVARQIEESGFLRGAVGNLTRETDQTLVMYQAGQRRAAARVAKELGGVATQEIDRDVEAASDGADVVVILGQDRVGG